MDGDLHTALDTRALHHDVESVATSWCVVLEKGRSGRLGLIQSSGGGLRSSSAREDVTKSSEAVVDTKVDPILVAEEVGVCQYRPRNGWTGSDGSHVDDDSMCRSVGLSNRQSQQSHSTSSQDQHTLTSSDVSPSCSV